MKNLYKISNSEKKRIIEMHQNSTKRHYLFETASAIVNYGSAGDAICDIMCDRKVAKYGSNGDFVKRLQHAFINNGLGANFQGGGMYKGCKTDYNKCDGLFRDKTQDAVEEFQKKYDLPQTGIVDSTTLKKICEVLDLDTRATYGDAKGIDWKMLCNNFCGCDEETTDDVVDDDLIGNLIGGGNQNPKDNLTFQGEISTNCDRLWSCFINHLWLKRDENQGKEDKVLEDFLKCVKGEKIKDTQKPMYSCDDCKEAYPTGYINKMPTTTKSVRNTELENYCKTKCNYKVAS